MHYTLIEYGKWGFAFTSPMGSHRLDLPRKKAEAEMAAVKERHRLKSLGDGCESLIFREFFGQEPEPEPQPEPEPPKAGKPAIVKCRECSKPAMLGTDICRECAAIRRKLSIR